MSNLCACIDPVPVKSPNNKLYCGNCGSWIDNDKKRKEKTMSSSQVSETESNEEKG